MTGIDGDTLISYPDGALSARSTVLRVEPMADGRAAVVLAATAAHPVDPTWPDQGPDLGALVVDGRRLALRDVRIGAWDGSALHLGATSAERLPVRLGTEGWSFVVVHVVDAAGAPAAGDEVDVEVDPSHRRALSAGHTACHLASLALNEALAGFWTKEVRADSLGRPDFDQAAIQSSLIRPFGSTDEYRIGKSLRKSGFDSSEALADLDAVRERVDATLAAWIRTDAAVAITREQPTLSARRTWRCALPAGDASIPCGGTHVPRLGELGTVTVAFELDDTGTTLTMRTEVAGT